MSILVFGQSGQVATELQAHPGVVALGRDRADLSRPETCVAALHAHRPCAVINAAAYTNVDQAEVEEPLAHEINGVAPGIIAQTCAELGIPLVHLSTDYVFDGQGTRAWRPDAPIAPINAYGRTKAEGEAAVRAAGGAHVILRTSWVFSSYGANFVKTILRLSESRADLSIVADQIGGPTPARALAQACLTIVEQLQQDGSKGGTYHFSGAPDASWCDFAQQVVASAGRSTVITPISTAEYPTPAVRPLNSRLDCSATQAVFGLVQPDWRTALQAVVNDMEGGK